MSIEQRCKTWPDCAVQSDVDEFDRRDRIVDLMKSKKSLTPIFLYQVMIAVTQRELAMEKIDWVACANCPYRTLEAE